MNLTHCDTCHIDFKNIACYKKHLRTSRHMLRSSDSAAVDVPISCICGKLYSYYQSLYVHHKKCKKYQDTKLIGAGNPISMPTTDTPIEIMQKKIEIYEKENNDRDIIIEKMQRTLDISEHERNKMKNQIDNLNANLQQKTQEKSRDKRKKISNDIRKQIVTQQNNACGECELALTPYYQIDHIIGLQFGGTDDGSNLMALCCECHAKKSVSENQCRQQIKEAIQMIWRENVKVNDKTLLYVRPR